MRLKLQNIGIIESADINVDGITLIAGQNDSGKSTVGKVLYSIVRSFNINEKSFNSSKVEYIRNRNRDIRNLLLRTKSVTETDKTINEKFLNDFVDNRQSIFNRLIRINTNNPDYIDKMLVDLDLIEELYSSFSNETLKLQLENFIIEIKNRLEIERESVEVLIYELESYLEDQFGKQIKNKFSKEDSFILIDDKYQKKILINDKLEFKGFEQNNNFYYDEVFFIESPILLEKSSYWLPESTSRDKNTYLNTKIFEPEIEQDIFSDNREDFEKLSSIISEVIGGNFEINSNEELVFKKSDVEFDFENIATGIKSFGILQLLFKKGKLNSNTLLIIDEPEVHLHPTWQVKYAEILVLLSKEFAIPILLTSHSPYFIEALEAFTKKYKYLDSTNFYFAEKSENGLTSNILNVNDSLSKIYSSISEASYQLRNIESDE
ncbi:AAA family ATPase [Flavobacterium sp.]|uniref:AAA family ATPase n=1 Tax=Flavobacterium sp. TaxID=239 RepID=UPI00375089FD